MSDDDRERTTRPELVLQRSLTADVGVRRWSFAGSLLVSETATAHSDVEIAWVDSGILRYRIARRVLEAGPGDVVVVPEGVVHATDFMTSHQGGAVGLSTARLSDIARAMGGRTSPRVGDPLLLRGAKRIVALARMLEAEASSHSPGERLVADGLADAIAVDLLRQAGAPSATGEAPLDRRLERAREVIHERFADRLGLDDLARAAGMSRYQFSRCFRAALGVSPYRYLLETRLAAAEALLRTGRHSVTDAALSVGFSDFGRFGRMFKVRTGFTPSAFARRAR